MCLKYVKGTLLKVKTVGQKCGRKAEWCNQPLIKNLTVMNLLLSSAILFTGSLPSKIFRMFRYVSPENCWYSFHKHAGNTLEVEGCIIVKILLRLLIWYDKFNIS